ncbi:MAG: DUF5702 domain-containing protein [Clostridiales bacterium]|nr:DUF5702 domain-containing protein [Eubacteriales bacterium]MDH7565814.1 DUF5702 domain-containing protein [Clostridiales bacterium]
MGLKNQKGQITVFLSIVLMTVIMMAGVLVDGARVVAGKNQVKRAVVSGAKSVLANYSSRLKNEYGLFVLSENRETALSEEISHYVGKNLMVKEASSEEGKDGVYDAVKSAVLGYTDPEDARQVNLYDYRIERISVTPFFNSTENEVVKNQILQYMKYRAPKEIVEGVWEKLKSVGAATKMSEAYKKKTKVDRLAGKAAQLQEDIKKSIDGEAGGRKDNSPCVNRFNEGGIRETLVNQYAALVVEYKELLYQANSPESSNKDGLLEKKAEILKELAGVGDALRTRQTEAFIHPNEEAARGLGEIIRLGKDINAAGWELKNYMENTFADGDAQEMTRDFKAAVNEDVKGIMDLVPGEEEALKAVEDLSSNCKRLREAVASIDEIQRRVGGMTWENGSVRGDLSFGYIVSALNRGLKDYKTVRYDYKKNEKASGGQDPRDGIEKKARESMGYAGGKDVNFREEGINPAELPSAKKYISDVSGINSGGSEKESIQAGDGKESGGPATSYWGDFKSLGDEIEFHQKEEGFSEKAFGFISSMGGILSRNLEDLRDEIYIDEYIVGTFKSAVPVPEKSTGTQKDTRPGGERKEGRQSFFDCEVEYILHGSPSQNTNQWMTKAQILLIRFGLNTLHVYTDPEKKALAETTAAAVSGWWTGGLGIPLVSNLIMCSWGMGEALLDMERLMKGESIPFYKSRGDWKLDIGLGKTPEPKTDGNLKFSYTDYLRLLLLLESSEDKLNRIEDVIELNVQKDNKDFKMGLSNTYIRVEAEVSMNYLFITSPFMPRNLKTRDGRHLFHVVIYEGY